MKDPKWSVDILLHLNHRMNQNETLLYWTPIFADVRVFSYPLLLTGLYIFGIFKKNDQPKKLALYLFLSSVSVFVFNCLIKLFVNKPRPYIELSLDTPQEELFLKEIPNDTFPSDHAAVSATIATGLLYRGIKNNKKSYIRLSIPFRLFALSMGIGRVMIAVHRPTDIIAGFIVGILTAVLVYNFKTVKKIINTIITIEKKILTRIGKKIS